MNHKLTILGGSSPYTAALVDAILAACDRLAPMSLMLQGRTEEDLSIVARYAARRLDESGWDVRWTTSLDEALDGSDIVIHQIRYGGLEGRLSGERLCTRLNFPADETLGPAALLTGLRSTDACRQTAEAVRRHCLGAAFINLTNPLSSTTALLWEAGVRECVGLCELPLVTARAVATALAMPFDDLDWSYSGLNHRGFIHSIRINGTDAMGTLLEKMNGQELGGVRAATIAEMGAVPLKYFRLVQGPRGVPGPSRALELVQLRRQLLAELARADDGPPPSLARRYLEWYPQAVVPYLEALQSREPQTQVLNLPSDDGIVREMKAEVCASSMRPLEVPLPGGLAGIWLRTFERHERAFLGALRNASAATIQAAIEADPLIPVESQDTVARAVWAEFNAGRREVICPA